MSTDKGPSVAERYIDAVNHADELAVLGLFAVDAVLRHPLGTYQGAERIGGFYRDVVFAGKAHTEITRLVDGAGVEVAQIEATSPLGGPGDRAHAVDVFVLDERGLISELEIYYR